MAELAPWLLSVLLIGSLCVLLVGPLCVLLVELLCVLLLIEPLCALLVRPCCVLLVRTLVMSLGPSLLRSELGISTCLLPPKVLLIPLVVVLARELLPSCIGSLPALALTEVVVLLLSLLCSLLVGLLLRVSLGILRCMVKVKEGEITNLVVEIEELSLCLTPSVDLT